MARPAIIIMPIRPCDFLTSDKPLTLGRRCPTTTVNRFSLPRRVPPIIQRVVLRPVRRRLGGVTSVGLIGSARVVSMGRPLIVVGRMGFLRGSRCCLRGNQALSGSTVSSPLSSDSVARLKDIRDKWQTCRYHEIMFRCLFDSACYLSCICFFLLFSVSQIALSFILFLILYSLFPFNGSSS